MSHENGGFEAKSIDEWIVSLQGTGRFELNAIVNDLIVLRQMKSDNKKMFDILMVRAMMRQVKSRVTRLLSTPEGLMPDQINTLEDVLVNVTVGSEG